MTQERNKYFFSVEGETEKWYLDWLKRTVNQSDKAQSKIAVTCYIEKNPLKCAKRLAILQPTQIYHLSDYESDEEIHVQGFKDTMDNMKKAERLGKKIEYRFGYSNFTFELWMILHKADCNACYTHRRQYIKPLNQAYSESFEDLDQYKHKDNFDRVLSKLTLDDVISAVNRSKTIMRKNKENGYTLHQYKGFTYYKENPSLMIWEAVEKILSDSGIM